MSIFKERGKPFLSADPAILLACTTIINFWHISHFRACAEYSCSTVNQSDLNGNPSLDYRLPTNEPEVIIIGADKRTVPSGYENGGKTDNPKTNPQNKAKQQTQVM